MKYFILLPLEILAMIVAYLTNPFVCLFANEKGELPPLFSWWQTWDNPLDIDWMVYEEGCTPKIFHYDFNKHYKYHWEDHENNAAGYVELLDPNFTVIERIQRYFCRLAWMYRNCNYGFSYDVTGRDVDTQKIQLIMDIDKPNNEQWISIEKNDDIWNMTWALFYCKQYCKRFKLRVYLGWKLKGIRPGYTNRRHMLAFHINPFRKVDIE